MNCRSRLIYCFFAGLLCTCADAQESKPDPWVPDHVETRFDIVYAKYGERELHLDLYRPTEGAELRPAVLVVPLKTSTFR